MNEKQQQRLYQLLGENVKKHRSSRKLTQEQLSKAIDLTRTSVVNIEQGRQHPPLHLLLQIAAVLGVTLEVLIPKEAEYAPSRQLDNSTLKEVKDRDKFNQFYEAFLKTSNSHDQEATKTD